MHLNPTIWSVYFNLVSIGVACKLVKSLSGAIKKCLLADGLPIYPSPPHFCFAMFSLIASPTLPTTSHLED